MAHELEVWLFADRAIPSRSKPPGTGRNSPRADSRCASGARLGRRETLHVSKRRYFSITADETEHPPIEAIRP